jgi:type VI secretion system protein ImpL
MVVLLITSLVVVLGVGAVWCLGWFFGLALTVKIALTVIIVALALCVLAIRYILKLRSSARLAKEITAPKLKDDKADGRRQDMLDMKARAARALAVLKGTRVGAAGRAALSSLPWYLVIGPPGVGKTTAILHSGLEFPLEGGGLASKFQGVGGTRNCDWWFTNEGIFLDTAGRYATQDDQEEWLAFLDLVRANRARRPFNGLVVALSVSDLLGANDADLAIVAARIRARMDEVTTRLKTLVPVYVLITKLDLVAGFSDFWSDLRASERGKLWGVTFPFDMSLDAQRATETEFDLLLKRLHARLKRRLSNERSVDVRRSVTMFPAEFVRLKTNLASVVGQLFKANAYQELPRLRGVYFTSGTQNVTPSSLVAAAMAKALAVRAPAPGNTKVEAKSFFLTDVFRRIIFPDRALAGRTAGEARRNLLFKVLIASFAVFLSAMLLVPGAITWSRNRALAKAVSDSSQALEQASWSSALDLERNVPALDDTRARLEDLEDWRQNGVPVQLRWGMYSGDNLFVGLRDVYVTALSRAVLGSAKRELEDRIRGFDAGPVRNTETFNRDFDTLKLYLMLGSADNVDPQWAAPRLARVWSQLGRVSPNKEEVVMGHLVFLLDLARRGNLALWTLDATLTRRARSTLGQVPQLDRMYESLVRDANAEIAPIRRESVFYGAVAPFMQSRNSIKVSGAYTVQGWNRVRVLLGAERSRLAAEAWVLGDTPGGGVDDVTSKLESLYFDRYRAAWRDFLSDLAVRDPENAEIAIDELNAFAEPEWPYLRLIRVLRENVILEPREPQGVVDRARELLDAGAPKPRLSPVEKAFKPMLRFGVPQDGTKETDSPPITGLTQYEALLQKVIGALTDLRDGESAADPRKMSDVFQDAFRSTTALLSEQDEFTRPLLAPLLMSPITLAWKRVVHDAGASAGASWESGVYQKWHTRLEGRYPFVASSQTDAPLEDFLDFFAPTGALWTFYAESLKPTLDRSGSTFVPARRFKSAIGYTSEFLDTCLRRGDQITTVLFPPKSDHAVVAFEVNIHSVSPLVGEVTVTVDGVSHSYRNEPEQWVRIAWPGQGTHGAQLQVRGAGGLNETIARPGDWGLFRLLDGATIQPGRAGGQQDGTPTLVATWPLSGSRDRASVSLDLRPFRAETPLVPRFFDDYKCPSTITTQ